MKAFGKREKKIDKLTGREEEFDQEIVDEDDNENDVGKETTTTTTPSKSKKQNATKVKVKINNLAYRTSKETLTNNCLRFGPVKEVHMILEGPAASNRNFHNSGRAYVTFESEDAAQSCLEGLKTLDGRPLRVSNALARPKTPKGKDGRASSASLLNNEVSKDISTICFRCK
ncbi:MAG: RNA recognition motif-containing protein, partial [Bacillariaceae sp.]